MLSGLAPLAEMRVLRPPDDLVSDFEAIMGPIIEVIKRTYFKIKNLRQTRDLLLPKLISGEVDVGGHGMESQQRGI